MYGLWYGAETALEVGVQGRQVLGFTVVALHFQVKLSSKSRILRSALRSTRRPLGS